MSSFALTYPHLRFATVGKADKYRRHQTICFSHEYFFPGRVWQSLKKNIVQYRYFFFLTPICQYNHCLFLLFEMQWTGQCHLYKVQGDFSELNEHVFLQALSARSSPPPHLESGTTSKTLLSSISHSVSAGTFRDILSLCIQLLSSNVKCSVFFNC